jgi:hypothetical protein
MAGSVVRQGPILHRDRGIVGIEADLTTDASGVVSEVVIGEAYGRLKAILYNGGLDAAATVTFKQYPGPSSTSVPVFTHTTGTEGTPVYLAPTDIITDNAGANVTAADTAPNVNRDIYIGGKVTVTVSGGGNAETGTYVLIIDEQGLGEPALTV